MIGARLRERRCVACLNAIDQYGLGKVSAKHGPEGEHLREVNVVRGGKTERFATSVLDETMNCPCWTRACDHRVDKDTAFVTGKVIEELKPADRKLFKSEIIP
jgi:hypothetical protein